MKRFLTYFTAALLMVFVYETIVSFAGGIAGHTRKNSLKVVGCICHTADSLSNVVVRISGPTQVLPNSTNIYRVTMRGGPAETGGFDFNVFLGSVDTVPGEVTTHLVDSGQGYNDISHSFPKPFSSDSVSWLVKYIAPNSSTIVIDTLYATGNSTNNNFSPDDSDHWNFAPNFIVEVNPSIGIQQISTVAEKFSLGQNYPNPFNPQTKLKFEIQKTGFVSLKVYDATGREVAELVNKELSSGKYEVQWDASGFASGVYYYRMASGDFSSVKKMILLK